MRELASFPILVALSIKTIRSYASVNLLVACKYMDGNIPCQLSSDEYVNTYNAKKQAISPEKSDYLLIV